VFCHDLCGAVRFLILGKNGDKHSSFLYPLFIIASDLGTFFRAEKFLYGLMYFFFEVCRVLSDHVDIFGSETCIHQLPYETFGLPVIG
jgi:hypothetical protein